MQTSIEVAILSEDRMFREVLAMLLAGCAGLRVAVTGADPAAVAPEVSPARIDVVLIDTAYGPRGALGRVRAARDRWPEAKAVVLGLDHEDESVADYVEAGAHAYVLQSASPEGLVAVIREVRDGRSPCSPRVVTAVLRRIAALAEPPATPPPAVEPLTPRERETLALIACGLGNKEVCHRLHITVQTVKNHVHSILAKLQVRRRREAVRLAFELGLLAEPAEGAVGPPRRDEG